MIDKRPIRPDRIRQIPSQFSWVDHRLVRDGRIDACSHASAALYLFLVTVADAQGLSFYSDASVMERLHMDAAALAESRRQLAHLGLIAYAKPIYQVLPLDPVQVVPEKSGPRTSGDPECLGRIFRQIMEEGR